MLGLKTASDAVVGYLVDTALGSGATVVASEGGDDTLEGGAADGKSIGERAQELKGKNGGRSRVHVPVEGGAVQVDLDGKAHGGVETPHVQEWQDNVIPSGPRAGEVGSRSKVGDVRPATQEDLDLVEQHLGGQE